jgi:hypothetical protein
VRRTLSRSLLIAVTAATLVGAGATAGTAAASKCTRAQSMVRVSRKQLNRDNAALRRAAAQVRRHPGSAAARRNLARARVRVRADNRVLNKRKQSYEQNCLPGY